MFDLGFLELEITSAVETHTKINNGSMASMKSYRAKDHEDYQQPAIFCPCLEKNCKKVNFARLWKNKKVLSVFVFGPKFYTEE